MKVRIWMVWIVALTLLSGCASVVKIEGDQLVNKRLSVKVTDAWNKVSIPGSTQPFEAWTQEGLALDHLRFWAAIKTGQTLMAPPPSPPAGQKAPRVPTFRASMPPDELVGLFELAYSIDGSVVAMQKVEPSSFAGEAAVRFEFTVARKADGVHLKGVGWVAVRKGELFAATFVAPRLSFFSRILPKAEAVIATASIKAS